MSKQRGKNWQLVGGGTGGMGQSFPAVIMKATMNQPTNSTILRGLFRKSLSIYQCFWPISTAHRRKLPFPSFQSKSRHHCWIRWPRFPKQGNDMASRRRFRVFFLWYFYFRSI